MGTSVEIGECMQPEPTWLAFASRCGEGRNGKVDLWADVAGRVSLEPMA